MKSKLLLISLIFISSIVTSNSQTDSLATINLGHAVNSSCEELSPVISADGNTLFFCRTNCEGNLGKDDIWVSYKKDDGSWTKAVNVGMPLNTYGSNFPCSVSPDGNNMLLATEVRNGDTIAGGIFISHKSNGRWNKPEQIVIKDFQNYNEYAGFYLSNDGLTLLMTIQDGDSYGEKDIYVSFRKSKLTWSKPMNLGPVVNTKGDELSPFLASDGSSLYFSSNGRKGFGKADVYLTRRLDKTWQSWSVPENLGPSINTPEWDAGYKIAASGDYAYYVSTQNTLGKSDIFKVQVPEKVRPNVAFLAKGMVSNARTRVPIITTIAYYTHTDGTIRVGGELAGTANSDSIYGKYTLTMPAGELYSCRVSANGFITYIGALDARRINKYKVIHNNVELVPIEDSLICMRNIIFAKNSSGLTKESKKLIRLVAGFLKENKEFSIQITGFTDDTGPADVNLRLSNKRAKSAVRFISSLGIPKMKILYSGKGEENPIIGNTNDYYRNINRRVEFKLVHVSQMANE